MTPFLSHLASCSLVLGLACGAAFVGAVPVDAMSVPATPPDILIPEGTIGLQPVSGQLKSLKNAPGNSTTLVLEYSLGTCVDQLLPVSYKAEQRNGTLFVYVSALNAKGNAIAVLCTPGPYLQQANVTVPGRGYSANRIKIVNLMPQSGLVR
jgi:hypothetical protein